MSSTPPIKPPSSPDPQVPKTNISEDPNLSKTQSQSSKIYSGPLVSDKMISSVTNQNPTSVQKFIQESIDQIVGLFRKSQLLQKDINNLEEASDEVKSKQVKIEIRNKNSEIKEIISTISVKEQELIKELNSRLKQKQAIEHLPIRFSKNIYIPEDNSEGQIKFLSERLFNNLNNLYIYLSTANDIIYSNLERIFSEFCPEHKGINIEEIRFELKSLGEETHNGGKIPIEISLYKKPDTFLKKLVYKPRTAETEIAVLELFKELNKIKNEHKLPVYQIVRLEKNQGSIWEFIEGEHLQTIAAEDLALKKANPSLGIPSTSLQEAEQRLLRLQTVCQKIGATDLNYENVIFRNKEEYIPIDFEIINYGHLTGLYGEKEPLPLELSDKEENLIKQFNEAQLSRLCRIVPIPTSLLMQAGTTNQDIAGLAEQISSLLKDEYSLTIDISELQALLSHDIINGDVPTFSQKNQILYYGVEEKQIAIKKEKK